MQTLGKQLWQGIYPIKSLTGELVRTANNAWNEVDVWDSHLFILSDDFTSTVIYCLPSNTLCVITNTFFHPDENEKGLAAFEVISSTGICGWISAWDLFYVET